ncbi:MAG: hypothetical protein HQL72_04930 [Magnetococcales bacterium]|nr:hypothetical protein [Magnetococcales bacterium]
MQESIRYQQATNPKRLPLPLALNGILTPREYEEQTQLGLLRGVFQEEPASKSTLDLDLYHPYFIH